MVPPETMSEGRGMPGGSWSVRIVTSAELRSSEWRSRAVSAARATPMSGGSDSKPQTWTTLTPAASASAWTSRVVRATNGISPREVDVVGAAGDAGVDHRAAVGGVGADEVEDDLGALGHGLERLGVGHVRGDRGRALDADVGERRSRASPGLRAAAAQVASTAGRSLRQVLGDLATGDARRAEEGDVDVSLGHRPILGGAVRLQGP